MIWEPPTGRPKGALLVGGPHGGEVRDLAGTHAVAAPIIKKDGRLWWFEGRYEWVRNDQGEITGEWRTL